MTTNWIEEFNRGWKIYVGEEKIDLIIRNYIQSFIEKTITTLLEKQREEYVEMIEKLKNQFASNINNEPYNLACDDIINIIKK